MLDYNQGMAAKTATELPMQLCALAPQRAAARASAVARLAEPADGWLAHDRERYYFRPTL